MLSYEILFEDNDIIVCYKPAGLAVQTKRLGQQDLESQLKNYRMRKKEAPYIGIIHRLDQPVEGVMVFAKNPGAAAKLSKQVQGREIGKYYYAASQVAADVKPAEKKGTLTDYLGFDQRKNLGYLAKSDDTNAKKAVLDYEILAEKADGQRKTVIFGIMLHTGRHHQIRLQLAHLGFPLIGDTKYGGVPAPNLGLCSYRLEFKHPTSGKLMKFEIQPKNPGLSIPQLPEGNGTGGGHI